MLRWCCQGNTLVINPSKWVSMLVSSQNKKPPVGSLKVTLSDNAINQMGSTNYLGVHIHECLNWEQHKKQIMFTVII